MKYAVYRETHKGNTRWLTRPVREGEPENYKYVFDGEDAKLMAWEKAKELNAQEGRVPVAA